MSLDQSSASQQIGPIAYAGHVTAAIGVTDMERSRSWFQDLLGFEPIYKRRRSPRRAAPHSPSV